MECPKRGSDVCAKATLAEPVWKGILAKSRYHNHFRGRLENLLYTTSFFDGRVVDFVENESPIL